MFSSKIRTRKHIGHYSLKIYLYKTFKLSRRQRDSEEELADNKEAYLDFKGDMDQVMESAMCAVYRGTRIRDVIQQAVDARGVPSYSAFVRESKQKMNARKRRAQELAKEVCSLFTLISFT